VSFAFAKFAIIGSVAILAFVFGFSGLLAGFVEPISCIKLDTGYQNLLSAFSFILTRLSSSVSRA